MSDVLIEPTAGMRLSARLHRVQFGGGLCIFALGLGIGLLRIVHLLG